MTNSENPLAVVTENIPDAPISAYMAIASMALQMALQWHKMSLVTDGVLYQQYKMEGRNIQNLDLVDVFETAKRFEIHLLEREKAVKDLVIHAVDYAFTRVIEGKDEPSLWIDKVQAFIDGDESVILPEALKAHFVKDEEDESRIDMGHDAIYTVLQSLGADDVDLHEVFEYFSLETIGGYVERLMAERFEL